MRVLVIVTTFAAPTVKLGHSIYRINKIEELPTRAQLKDTAVLNFGGNASDYAILGIIDANETNADITRIDNERPEFTFTWGGVDETEVPAISFAIEDGKHILFVTAPGGTLAADGVATKVITFQLHNQSPPGIDTTVNANRFISCRKPNGQVLAMQISFTNGEGTITFRCGPEDAGEWFFPNSDNPGQNMKIVPASVKRIAAFITAF